MAQVFKKAINTTIQLKNLISINFTFFIADSLGNIHVPINVIFHTEHQEVLFFLTINSISFKFL